MNHIGLFAGIGGFEIAAQAIGWETIAVSEIDPFCQKVLNKQFPKTKIYGDITSIDFTIYRGKCDILTGGFPCQPYSIAGHRKGDQDERHLWPEMLRAIREIKPSFVVAENVYGLLNWSDGRVITDICASLESEGYEVTTLVLPASAVEAPHERYRLWIVAHAHHQRQPPHTYSEPTVEKHINGSCHTSSLTDSTQLYDRKHQRSQEERPPRKLRDCTQPDITTDSVCSGWIQGCIHTKSKKSAYSIPDWRSFPAQSPVLLGDDGISYRLDAITFPRWCRETIKAAGNAIVPRLAYIIFKSIQSTL